MGRRLLSVAAVITKMNGIQESNIKKKRKIIKRERLQQLNTHHKRIASYKSRQKLIAYEYDEARQRRAEKLYVDRQLYEAMQLHKMQNMRNLRCNFPLTKKYPIDSLHKFDNLDDFENFNNSTNSDNH